MVLRLFRSSKKVQQGRSPRLASRQAPIFSYHANRAVRESSQLRDAGREARQVEQAQRTVAKKQRLMRLPRVAAALAVAFVAVLCLQLSSQASVVPLGTKEGQKLFLRDKGVYEAAVRQAFSTFSNRNKLTVNGAKISADLKRQFPELQTVSVSLPVIGDRPKVYIQPAVPQLILVGKNGMFVLDNNGRALISGNQVPRLHDLGIPVVNDQSDIGFETGDIALPRFAVAFITEVIGQLSAKELRVASATLPIGSNELHVKIEGQPYTVKFNLHGRAREEAGSFIAVKEYLEGQRRVPSEYIDVRVENKAYYR